jgi:hypothetical protein
VESKTVIMHHLKVNIKITHSSDTLQLTTIDKLYSLWNTKYQLLWDVACKLSSGTQIRIRAVEGKTNVSYLKNCQVTIYLQIILCKRINNNNFLLALDVWKIAAMRGLNIFNVTIKLPVTR